MYVFNKLRQNNCSGTPMFDFTKIRESFIFNSKALCASISRDFILEHGDSRRMDKIVSLKLSPFSHHTVMPSWSPGVCYMTDSFVK